jgi:5-(carboxyamino)imidazole ribonucleotide mutase
MFQDIENWRRNVTKYKHKVPYSVGATSALVGIVMGSKSDLPTMEHACVVLENLGIPFEVLVVSAHRTPRRMFDYAEDARGRGLKVIIAGAGGAAHLPGMISGSTPLPVHGVPVQSKALNGLDSLLSIVQMPKGVPTATFSIGDAGAVNAALQAVRVLALFDKCLSDRLDAYIADQTKSVPFDPFDE